MRHAFLIIAHNEFVVLQNLIDTLDNVDNDIYVHIDKKVKNIPILITKYSKLIILRNRIDVRWGNISQIKAEYELFRKAYFTDNYSYFHLISGVHLPLVNKVSFDSFFRKIYGKTVFSKMYTDEYEINLKLRKYNFFTKFFKSKNKNIERIFQFGWLVFIKLQKILRIKINKNRDYYKAANWISITPNHLKVVLDEEKNILNEFKYTLCGDEFFVPTILIRKGYKEDLLFLNNYLKCDFRQENPKVYTLNDYEKVINSGCIFARKFSNQHVDVVKKILAHIGINK